MTHNAILFLRKVIIISTDYQQVNKGFYLNNFQIKRYNKKHDEFKRVLE